MICHSCDVLKRKPIFFAVLCFALASAAAHEPREPSDVPGFRPDAELADKFVQDFDTATIAVHPTIVRRATRTAHSYDSQAQIIGLLDSAGITTMRGNQRIKLGKLPTESQWSLFLSDLSVISDAVRGRQPDADYHLVAEFILPIHDDEVFGIHCYIVDQAGNNAFSFLLNSHHRLFVDAGLIARDSSENARSAMFSRAGIAAFNALRAQVVDYRARSERRARRQAALAAGDFEEIVFDDFSTAIPAREDAYGNSLGFNTFSDPASRAEFSLTDQHPPVPDEQPGNQVLRLDLDVEGWAVFAHLFYFADGDEVQWMPVDWRRYDGFSFWFYGTNSGANVFMHIFDNRHPGSTRDDAERYGYAFTDNFSGWQRMNVAFEDFSRQEIYNGAPNDGFGLSAVHGWTIGATQTDGAVTLFIDDFSLQHVGAGAHDVPDAIGANVDYAINELPMYGLREKTEAQKRADEDYIATVTRDGRTREDAAQVAAKNAWNIFYAGDKRTAIRRFNQAWLLDPDNQLALWGFAVTCIDRGQLERADEFYRMAIESGPFNPALERDYRLLRQKLADAP